MTMRRLAIAWLGPLGAGAPGASAQKPQKLPTRFVADRFFVAPVTACGDTILLFTDSGGGGPWVIKPALELLGFTPKFEGVEEGDSSFTGGKWPIFRADASIPSPLGETSGDLGAWGTKAMTEMEGAVGMLGQRWFAGRVWIVDYAGKQLSVY